MTRIGLISDTHGYLHPALPSFFSGVDEIWHCGDIGNEGLLNALKKIRPTRAVYGNIDGQDIRKQCRESEIFTCESVKVLMTHIGGYPGRYEPRIRTTIIREKPGLFVCGHSHILKVIYDQKHELLHINPGAAGKFGLHQIITMIRFEIEGSEIRNLEISENKK